jgi:hypothetical protein
MSTTLNLRDYDVVYISYDEPNAEANWSNVLKYIPTAKRVSGVKGIATAHMAAAELSTTRRTLTIDGDNFLIDSITDQTINIPELKDNTLINWPGKNIVNGLRYGNGSIKLWPTDILAKRSTNELAEPGSGKSIDYNTSITSQVIFHRHFSEVRMNGSPLQAWRTGFREGFKLCLGNGKRFNDMEVWAGGTVRLGVWMNVGADVENGIWTILGARMGCYSANFTSFEIDDICNYDVLNDMFHREVGHLSYSNVLDKCNIIGESIKTKYNISQPLSSSQSAWFKRFDIHYPDKVPNAFDEFGYHWSKKEK